MNKAPLLLASLVLMLSTPARADEVGITTALEKGEKIVVAVNADADAKLTWKDGTSVEVPGGQFVEIDVEAADATLTTTGNLTNLYLTDNALTALDVSNAPELKRLLCADNQLTELELEACTKLVELDCQNNRIKTLALSKNRSLEALNCANNALTSLSSTAYQTLTSIVCSGNPELKEVKNLATFYQLQQLWCTGNAFTSLSVNRTKELRQIVAANNQLTQIKFNANLDKLTDLWVENNQLEGLDLAGAENIETLSADNNKLDSILWNEDSKKTLENAYVQNNRLSFNSLPGQKYGGRTINLTYAPQGERTMPDYVDLNVKVNLAKDFYENGWGEITAARMVFTNSDGVELESRKDYTGARFIYTFKTEQTGVTYLATSSKYEGLELRSTPFNIGIPTGIDTPVAASGLMISSERGMLILKSDTSVNYTVTSMAGMNVAHGTVKGVQSIEVPAGIYVVNGVKVLVK